MQERVVFLVTSNRQQADNALVLHFFQMALTGSNLVDDRGGKKWVNSVLACDSSLPSLGLMSRRRTLRDPYLH